MADLSALLSDPQFQFGLSLLGNAHTTDPFAKAQQAMMGYQQQAAQQELLKQQGERMQQQTLNEKQQQSIALANFLLQRQLTNRVSNLPVLGGPGLPANQLPSPMEGLPPALQQLMGNQGMQQQSPQMPQQQQMPDQSQQPQQQMPMPQEAQQPPVGKFGTPVALLNNLVKTESSGNPQAIGPTVPGQGNAMGLYQFMPGTVQMLKKQGVDFNPLVPDQRLHDAADFYFQQLMKKNNGDVTAALNDWQGAKKTAGSNANLRYNAKVLTGVQMPPGGSVTQQSQGVQSPGPGQGIPNPGMPLTQAGAMMSLVNPAAATAMINAGKAMSPTFSTPGANQYDPMTGRTVQLPQAPLTAQQTSNITPAANGMTPADWSSMNKQNLQTAQEHVAASRDLVKDIPQTLDALQQAKAALPAAVQYTGPVGERRLQIAKFLNQAFPGVLNIDQNAITNADTFKSQITQPLLASVKTTGGRMSVQEIAKMQQNFGSLETDPKALQNIIDIMQSRYTNVLAEHNKFADQFDKMMGPAAHLDYRITPNAPATVGPAAAPAIGMVRNGYMFKGGDPAQKASWAPVPGAR